MEKAPLHIIFAGTSLFALPSLEALAADPAFVIDLVVTQPNRPVGREKVMTAPPVKIVSQKLGLIVWQPQNVNSEWNEKRGTKNEKPDFLVVVSYGQILSQEILDLPRVAPVNLHASLLPRLRGASPIQHAILAGDSATGVTIQRMVKELDAGPILAQEKTPIGARETFAELHDRLAHIGADLLIKTLKDMPEPQPQPEPPISCRKLTRADGIVDPSTMTAEEIDRRVRALNPWPGVTLHTQLKILETSLEPSPESTPLLCKNDTTLYLVKVQPAGKKPMGGNEWKRGHSYQ